MEGDTSRTRSEVNENKVQFVRIRDKNVNFVLCQFQKVSVIRHPIGGSRVAPLACVPLVGSKFPESHAVFWKI